MENRVAVSLLFALMVVSTALAGCTDTDEDRDGQGTDAGTDGSSGDRTDGGTGGSKGLGTGLAPLWFPGLYWEYTLSGGSLQDDATLGLLVNGTDAEGDWQVLVQGEPATIATVLQHGFPYLLAVDPETFAYDTHRGVTDLWDFPIEDNETWTATRADGVSLTATATPVMTKTPGDRDVAGHVVVFTAGQVAWLTTTYTPAAAGFTNATIDLDLDGSPDLTVTLEELGSTGTRSTHVPLQTRLIMDNTATGPTTGATDRHEFGPPAADATHVAAWVRMQGTAGYHRTLGSLSDGSIYYDFQWQNTAGAMAAYTALQVQPARPDDMVLLTHNIAGDGTTHIEVVELVVGSGS